jgi:hypothetical protein
MNGDALGRRITLEDHPKPGHEDWATIIGVVDDVRQESLTEKAHPAIYQPYTQVKKAEFLRGRCYPDPVRAEGLLRQRRRRMRGG